MNQDLPLSKDKFAESLNMYVKEGFLVLSSDLYTVCSFLNIRSARTLISYLQTFPDPFAKAIGLNSTQLRQLHCKLLKTLKGHIPNNGLLRSPQPKVTFGAKK